jgi:hypothetical protein
VLDVYVLQNNNAALLDAIASADTSNLPYTIEYGTRSYASLSATSQWLANNDNSMLANEGIMPIWWGSYPPADATRVALQAPTETQLTELQTAASQVLPAPPPTVTQETYSSVAAAVMNAQAPQGAY